MKERNRKGKFRRTETVRYTMPKRGGFDDVSWLAFQEAAAEKYDFSTCQRPDGSYYGTGGTCRKGSEVPSGVPDKGKKGSSGGGSGTSRRERDKRDAAIADKKKAESKMASGGAKNQVDSLKAKNKKLSDQYEKLRKDKSPGAEAKRKKIMSDFNKNFKKQEELEKKLDSAAKSQSPKAPRDSSSAGNQRRANAASNARD